MIACEALLPVPLGLVPFGRRPQPEAPSLVGRQAQARFSGKGGGHLRNLAPRLLRRPKTPPSASLQRVAMDAPTKVRIDPSWAKSGLETNVVFPFNVCAGCTMCSPKRTLLRQISLLYFGKWPKPENGVCVCAFLLGRSSPITFKGNKGRSDTQGHVRTVRGISRLVLKSRTGRFETKTCGMLVCGLLLLMPAGSRASRSGKRL